MRILLLLSYSCVPLDQLALRNAHPLLLAALLPMRFLPTRKSYDFFPRLTTSTYSQYFQPYRISAHRGTPNLSSTLSPQLAVSRTAAPLPVRYRLSAISYHYNFAPLALTVSTCATLLPRSYIVIKWSLEIDVKESFKQLTKILQLISIFLHYRELNNTYIHLLQLTLHA